MASDLMGQLERIGRLLDEIPARHDPLPMDVADLVNHAADDVRQARGKPREYSRTPQILDHFDVGDEVAVIVQAYAGPNGMSVLAPDNLSSPWVRPAKVIQAPKRRSPNDLEPNVGGKPWFFTSELPVTVVKEIDAKMHLELESDRREVYHLRGEHFSTWREKNGSYWTVLTIFKDHTQVTEVRNVSGQA